MKEITLSPDWSNVARWMITALVTGEGWGEDRKVFEQQLKQILDYLRATNMVEFRKVQEYGNSHGYTIWD